MVDTEMSTQVVAAVVGASVEVVKSIQRRLRQSRKCVNTRAPDRLFLSNTYVTETAYAREV